MQLKISVFGSSLLSSYCNSAATYYRGILKALYRGGHKVTFYEPNIIERQVNRDIEAPEYAQVVVYRPDEEALLDTLQHALHSDLVIKGSDIGAFDAELDTSVLCFKRMNKLVAYWDMDPSATLERLSRDPHDPFIALIPQYDFIFTCGGGQNILDGYRKLGAKNCYPIYPALDPDVHYGVDPSFEFACDLAFFGHQMPGLESRFKDFFLKPALSQPTHKFLLSGCGWHQVQLPENVTYIGHVPYTEYNQFHSTPKVVMHLSTASRAKYGFSPSPSLFEAAGAGACIISDYWEGLENFFEIGTEILVARDSAEVCSLLNNLTKKEVIAIGQAAKKKALTLHTYDQRAKELEYILFSKEQLAV